MFEDEERYEYAASRCMNCYHWRKAKPEELRNAPEGYEWGYCDLFNAYTDELDGCK